MDARKQGDARKRTLEAIITDHAVWEKVLSPERNAAAKQALCDFLTMLYSMPLDKEREESYEYLTDLVRIKRKLDKGNYVDACNELEKMVHFKPVFQARIHYNIVALLESYVKEGATKNAFTQ